MRLFPCLLASVLAFALVFPALAEAADWQKVEETLGVPGSKQANEVYKFSLPRTDLSVTLDGVTVKPALALGSWLAFQQTQNTTTLRGDLVLTQEEVTPVMQRLTEGGIRVTALHNHLLRATPFPMYVHIAGRGDPIQLAQTLRTALALSQTPLEAAPGKKASETIALDTARLDEILKYPGKAAGGVYKFAVPPAETIQAHGLSVVPAMGTATALSFQPTDSGQAVVYGDFVLQADAVNPVLRTLQAHGIEAMALHNHMLAEEPRFFFMHFWGHDTAEKLAHGLRVALDHIYP